MRLILRVALFNLLALAMVAAQDGKRPGAAKGEKPPQDPDPAIPDPQRPSDPSVRPPPIDPTKFLTIKKKLIFPDPGSAAILETLKTSTIGRIAMVLKTKNGMHRVMVNGKEQKPYPIIVPIDALAAAASRSNASSDPKALQPKSPGLDLSRLLRFAPNQERVYYTAFTGKGTVVASDNYESKTYDAVMDDMPIFSPDSKKIAFAVVKSGRCYIVVNDVESKDFDDLQIGTLVFSPNSQRLAYCARKSSEWRVFCDAGSFPAQEGVAEGSPIFSPDSKKFVYVAVTRHNKQIVVLDGAVVGEFEAVGDNTVAFSPDSKHLVYTAKLRGAWGVYVDGKMHGPYEAVVRPQYNKDGSRLAWAAKTGGQWQVFENGVEVFLPKDKKDKKPAALAGDLILKGTPAYSPDGKTLAVGLKREGSWMVWSEGELSGRFEQIRESSLTFATDSSKLAFVGVRDRMFVPVINFKELTPCLDITPVRISRGIGSGTVTVGVRRARSPEEIAAARKKNPKDRNIGEHYWMIVVNGEEFYGPYNDIQGNALSVSQNGARVAIPATDDLGWGICIDGERRTDGLPFWIRFHPDTHLMEMIAVTKEGYVLLHEILE